MPTLLDGTEVSATDERWRHECEARALAALALDERRAQLERIARHRGQAAADALRGTLRDHWAALRGARR